MASILVIDSCTEIRIVLCRLLTSLGYKARAAAGRIPGLESYQAEPADVILLDISMPEHDGMETLGALLQHDPRARVIAMTDDGMYKGLDMRRATSKLGARRALYKPVTPKELQSAIDVTLAMVS